MTHSESVKLVNELIFKCIPSDTVKNWITTSGHTFKFEELISILWNSQHNIFECIDNISVLKDRTLLEAYGFDRETTFNKAKQILNYIIDIQDRAYNSLSYCEAIFVKVTYEEQGVVLVLKDMSKLKSALDKQSNKLGEIQDIEIRLIDLNTSDTVAMLYINDDIVLNDFEIVGGNKDTPCGLNSYVNIPIDFKVGDRVCIHGTDTVFVVCHDNSIPANINGLDIFDSSVTVIPEDILDKNKSYAQQIKDILRSRKHDYAGGDIISIHHEHIFTILLERVE